jgi:Tfp pilus assembly protein PilX
MLKKKFNPPAKQRGIALIVFMMIVTIATVATIYTKYSFAKIKSERDQQTSIALQKAKEAVIYYSLNNSYLNSTTCTSSTDCARPGELPCPDRTNDGVADSNCGNAAGNNQTRRLSRLPWKTLGLEQLKDGYGETLWYAVSNSYKTSTRIRPLNSETSGTITIRDASGKVLYDATTGGGVVAVIFSPGPAITRQDGYTQSRDSSGINTAKNYLDVALGEDNADFVDGSTSSSNGFILGPVKDSSGNDILNDRLLVITRDEMAAAMEAYVLIQVRDALITYYQANTYYPLPASFSDTTCLGSNNISATSNCKSVALNYSGRIPVFNLDQVVTTSSWISTSILKGLRSGNWFQQNAWRELVYYAVAAGCTVNPPNSCAGVSKLTLNNSLTLPANTKNTVIISAGRALSGQSRSSNAEKTAIANYLEGENLSPLDNIFSRQTLINTTFNDHAMSIP